VYLIIVQKAVGGETFFWIVAERAEISSPIRGVNAAE